MDNLKGERKEAGTMQPKKTIPEIWRYDIATHRIERRPSYFDCVDATPLVQIFAITIHCNDRDISSEFTKREIFGKIRLAEPKKREIYGKIWVTDKLDDTRFNMYDRYQNNPELLSFGDTLLLTPPLETVIIPSEFASMTVKLYDGDIVIADETFNLDRTTTSSEDDWSESYQVKRVSGSENKAYVEVHYAIFPYAVAATVSVLFFCKDDHFDSEPRESKFDEEGRLIEPCDPNDIATYEENDCSTYAHLYGTLKASGVLKSNFSKIPYFSSKLFNKGIGESVKVKSGRFIELSRSVVVVPPYSTLKIDAAFFNRDTQSPMALGKLEFTPDLNFTCAKDIKGCDGRIRVRVVWNSVKEQLYKKLPPLEINDSGYCPLIEVFSIVVCRTDGMPFTFYGSIVVEHDGSQTCIFNRDESSPQVCPSSGMVVIPDAEVGCFGTFKDYRICVDLKDITGPIISKGHMLVRKGIDTEKYDDLRLCSVVSGEVGFTAIHYSIFPDGVSARVSVKLLSKCFPGTVKGEIYACYGVDKYFRCYQEKLFRSILFHNDQDELRFHQPSITLPLLKPNLSLPRESYLTITANLTISNGNDIVYLKGNVIITKDNCDSPAKIGQGDLLLEVSVQFNL